MTKRPSFAEVHAGNARAWNQTADWYRSRATEALPRLRMGGSTLHDVEQRLLSSLSPLDGWCDRAVHLQCSAGLDAHSLLNHGAASVVGVDIAEDLVAVARDLTQALGRSAEATFLCCDVLDVPEHLYGSADLVYTGKGAMHWMFDIAGWARVVTRLLRPGGVFLLFDFHAMMWTFRSDVPDMTASGVSYFAPAVSYTGWAEGHLSGLELAPDQLEPKRLRPWPPSAVIQSLLDAGLELHAFGEYPDSVSPAWSAYPKWRQEDRRKVATTYSVLARRAR